MRTETFGKTRTWRIWMFLMVLLGSLTWSAVVGTQPVRAASCTTTQCNLAFARAMNICNGHRGLIFFSCPLNNEPDDYFFQCNDDYFEIDDCGTNAPS
jgi:hypothetical protein